MGNGKAAYSLFEGSEHDQPVHPAEDHGDRSRIDCADGGYGGLSMATVIQVGKQLDELAQSYIPAYGHLARANIRSLERALDCDESSSRNSRSPSNDIAAIRADFDAKGRKNSRTKFNRHASLSAS